MDKHGGGTGCGGGGDEETKVNLKASGAEPLPDGRNGLRVGGWEIESIKGGILSSRDHQAWEEKLGTSHLPEMVFGENSLILLHVDTGVKLYFNAFDALKGWKAEGLPPVEVPAAEKWKFRSKPVQQVILDYDYTFTTPYCGSEAVEYNKEKDQIGVRSSAEDGAYTLKWEDCEERIDLAALSLKEPILFYDEVILYEDELADNGISLLSVKVRVMPNSWFLLLRFWLRVDGVLIRLRDTRMHCTFNDNKKTAPVILRENCWRETTLQYLCAKGFPSEASKYADPNNIIERLPITMNKTQKLRVFR